MKNSKFEALETVEINEYFLEQCLSRNYGLYLKMSQDPFNKVLFEGSTPRPKYKWFTEDLNALFLLEKSLSSKEKEIYLKRLQNNWKEELLFCPLNLRIQPLYETLVQSETEREKTGEKKTMKGNFSLMQSEPDKKLPTQKEAYEIIETELKKEGDKHIETQPQYFEVGEFVEWVSQANNNYVVKRGEVVHQVYPEENPSGFEYVLQDKEKPQTIRMRNTGNARKQDSYLILVIETKIKGEKEFKICKPTLYWPVVSKLTFSPVDIKI